MSKENFEPRIDENQTRTLDLRRTVASALTAGLIERDQQSKSGEFFFPKYNLRITKENPAEDSSEDRE